MFLTNLLIPHLEERSVGVLGVPLLAMVARVSCSLSTPRRVTMLAASLILFVALTIPLAQAAKPRPKAPPIAGVTLDGKRLSLVALRGKPVILNVWSSW